MRRTTRRRERLPIRSAPIVAVFVVLLLVGLAPAAPAPRLDDLRRQAITFEKNSEWLEACRSYDELIRRDRTSADAREGYHRCFRQFQIVRRHNDGAYREALKGLEPSAALDIYESVLGTIGLTYVDRGKVEINALFKHGVQEVRYALSQEAFVREHLGNARPGALETFKERLNGWPERKIVNRSDVRSLIMNLAGHALQDGLVQNKASFAVVLALEFAFGACIGLDEYTLFLTPQNYNTIQATLRGKIVGIGVELAAGMEGLEISRVYPNSPAAEAGLMPHMKVIRIDQHAAESMQPERAAELLRGDPKTAVEIHAAAPGMMALPYKLERRAVLVPTVEFRMLDDSADSEEIGYIRILSFQESTVKEVQEALAVLHSRGMKGLVLDLRGNPGGSFPAAVKIAEMFLPKGTIVHTMSQFKDFNKPFKVENSNALLMPMSVLIDSETASSAELLAGAIKENNRAPLFGDTTFGKGSIQCIIPLDKTPGGIRITVAKFTSPLKNPYNSVGVSPDFPVQADEKALIEAARQDLRMKLGRMMMMGM